MFSRLLFAKFISPKAKKFAKLQVFIVLVRNSLKVLNEVPVIKIEYMLPADLPRLYIKKYSNLFHL